MDLVALHAVVWEPLETTAWSTGTLQMFDCREIRWVQADHLNSPGLSLPLHCRTALQNMPIGLREYRDWGRGSDFRRTAHGLGKEPQWLTVKGSLLWRGEGNFIGRPKKAAFHLQTVPKKSYLYLLWNLPINRKQITKSTHFCGNCSKAKCFKPSAFLKVLGAWFDILKVEHTNSKERSLLSLAC